MAVSIDEAFDYTANFANLQDWDPGIAASAKTSNGPVGLGSAFHVLAKFGSREVPMVYEITEFDPPHRVVLTGAGGALTAVDEIRFIGVDGGTQVDYTADLQFSGLMRLIVPFMGGVLRKVGEKALDGLESRLGKLETA